MNQLNIQPTVKEQTSRNKTFWRVIVGPAVDMNEDPHFYKKLKPLVLVMLMLYQNKFLSVFNFSITILLSLIFLSTSKVFPLKPQQRRLYSDQTTGTVLLEKNADQPLPPASMSN